jgi:predicted nucleotidyltransferase
MSSRQYSNQLELAQHVIDYLEGLAEVESAILYGSLVNGNSDEFSDIDIEINVGKHDDAAFALRLPRLLDLEFEVAISDWRRSLLPDKYLQAFFIEGVPIFWSFDFAVAADTHRPLRTDPPRDELDSFLKLWCGNLKYWIRKDPRHARLIPLMAHRVLSDDAMADLDLRGQMVQSLEYVAMTSYGRKEKFIARCLEASKQYLGE